MNQSPNPLIGITTYGRDNDNHFSLPAEYVDAVRRAGGIPVLLPAGETQIDALLERLDGLIFSGGGDVNPELYAGQKHIEIYMVDTERDGTEVALARQVAASSTPTLCICRGTQLLNVALGGSLVEHLPDEVGETIAHRNPPQSHAQIGGYALHPLRVDGESRLAAILGTTDIEPASWHHQAVRRLADGLQVVARAEDGTIEAAESAEHPWLVAVQWHPEITAADDPSQQRIFDAFVEAARRNAVNSEQ